MIEANKIPPGTETHCPAISAVHKSGQLPGRLSQPLPLGTRGMVSSSRCVQSDMPNMGYSGCGEPNLQILGKATSVARTKNPLALALDALIIPWSEFELLYALPPV